mmetsp:Transcript_79545/g.171866  ORF Transcript_79545/g.171866 Transcript_79545/m.171866 type:complete len:206 (+) Transcript_79545:586-1203(+)
MCNTLPSVLSIMMLLTCLSPSPISYPTALITARDRVKLVILKSNISAFLLLKNMLALKSTGFFMELHISLNISYFCGTVYFSKLGKSLLIINISTCSLYPLFWRLFLIRLLIWSQFPMKPKSALSLESGITEKVLILVSLALMSSLLSISVFMKLRNCMMRSSSLKSSCAFSTNSYSLPSEPVNTTWRGFSWEAYKVKSLLMPRT